MEYFIKTKNQKLILSSAENKFEGKDFFLKPGVKLSDVFEFLPYGRINKKETGIGATTLEIRSPRHSIIVQPIRATAKSKSEKEQNLFYFDADDKKIELKLNQYLADSSIAWKKIILVIDSLPRLLALHKEFMQDYFLLIDEIDSIQRDSSFRTRLENAIDIYKLFPVKERALVSATLLSFSDKDLEDERLTSFVYKTKRKKHVHITFSSNPMLSGFQELRELLEDENIKSKILVAYNSVTGIDQMATALIAQGYLTSDDISLLIGGVETNIKVRSNYNTGFIEDGILPARVNFVTQAYFSGYDIEEDIVILIITDIRQQNTRLSFQEIIQIAGRCRKKTNKLIVVSNVHGKTSFAEASTKFKTQDELIGLAETQLVGLKCLESYLVGDNKESDFIQGLGKYVIETVSKFKYGLVRPNSSGKMVISYLAIDAKLIDFRAQIKLYRNRKIFTDQFTANEFVVHVEEKPITVQLETKRLNYEKIMLEELYEKLKHDPQLFLSEKQKNIMNNNEYRILRDIYKLAVFKFRSSSVLRVIQENLEMSKLKSLLLYLKYKDLVPGNKLMRTLNYYLNKKKQFTYDELIENARLALIEVNAIRKSDAISSRSVKKVLDSFFTIKEVKGFYKIVGVRKYSFIYNSKILPKSKLKTYNTRF